MLRWAAKIITSKSSSCYHIDTKVTSPNPSTSTLYIILLIASVSIYHTCVPKGIPKTWNFCSITDLIKGCHTQRRWILSPTIRWSNAMSSKIRVPNPWHAFGLVQSYKHQFAWLLVQVTWVTPKNDDRNGVTQTLQLKGFHLKKGTW